MAGLQSTSQEASSVAPDLIEEVKKGLRYLVDLTQPEKSGSICIVIKSISGPLVSKSGWRYRRMEVRDTSMEAEALISEAMFQDWKFKPEDCAVCEVKSKGIDSGGRLTVFFNTFLGPFDVSKLLYDATEQIRKLEATKVSRMRPSETVYQISAREARSLLVLVRLWVEEGKPQHYTKWCQMHQIVATTLRYMGLVERTGSMSGYYYPTKEALEFFEGKRLVAKKRVFVRGKDGQHVPIGDEGEKKGFMDYLSDYADRDSALKEYNEALDAYRAKFKAQ